MKPKILILLALICVSKVWAVNWQTVTGGYHTNVYQGATITLTLQKDTDYVSSTHDRMNIIVAIGVPLATANVQVWWHEGLPGSESYVHHWSVSGGGSAVAYNRFVDYGVDRLIPKNQKLRLGITSAPPGHNSNDPTAWEPDLNGTSVTGSTESASWVATGDNSQGSTAMRALPWTLTNTKNYAVRIEFVNSSNAVIAYQDVAALQSVNRTTAEMALTWATSSSTVSGVPGAIGVRVRVPANRVNGQWVSAAIASGDTIAIGIEAGNPYNAPGEPPDLDPPVALVLPGGMPESGTLPPDSQSVWENTGDTAALDKGTYREGVDKQIDEFAEMRKIMSGEEMIEDPTAAEFPAESIGITFQGNSTTSAGGTAVGNVVGMLPSMPNVFPGNITKTAMFSATLAFPYVGNKSFTVDMSDHETPIFFLRNMFKGLFALWFFFVEVITIRKAFAG
jgi:hypothetical protein